MGRRKKNERPTELTGEDLREAMCTTRDLLVFLVKKGYGDERNRLKIEQLREDADGWKREHPELWREVAAERPRDPEVEL